MICEFDAEGSDLPADTSTACALEVGGSVRGERGAADDVDWYRVGLQAGATYQFDMRAKSTGGWQLVDGVSAFVSVGSLEDPKLLGVYGASGALVPGTDSEVAGTGKDSRIASFSPDTDGVYYISASAEGAWTGTYELSLAVTAGEHVEGLTLLAPTGLVEGLTLLAPADLAPGGLEVSMVRNRLDLSWTAPAADAESVTGYEILRAEGEAEPTTLVADTQSTATTYTDDTATTAGVSYTYAVKALRAGEASVESGRASYSLPAGYLASTKDAASKSLELFEFTAETPKFDLGNTQFLESTQFENTQFLESTQFVVQPDQDQPTNIWNGTLILALGSQYWNSAGIGALTPNTFIFNGTTYTIEYIWAPEVANYFVYPYEYDNDLYLEFNPDLDAATYETWTFAAPGGREFYLAHATVSRSAEDYQQFKWSDTGWDPRGGQALEVSLTGLGGIGQPDPEPDLGPPGIKLSWTTKSVQGFSDFSSKPVKAGFEIYRYERNPWGNFASGEPRLGEVVNCDITESDGATSCLDVPSVRGLVESWTWTDETAERGVSYLYTIVPYHDFYSSDGTTVWRGITEDVIAGEVAEPAHRVRVQGRQGNVMHRTSHPSEPGTPTNLRASQPDSGDCTGSCVHLTWDLPANATKYVVFRTGQRTRETWVDHGLTYPQRRFGDPDLTVTYWEDTSAEAGVRYTYRVAAFNEDGLRSAGDAVVGFETLGGTTVPNKVPSLTADAIRTNATSAEVMLTWTAPEGISSVPNAKYLIEWRLNIPQRAEWEEDWKTVDGNVSATATTYSHTIALEKHYPRGGTLEPFEYVPTAFKDKLRLNDSDAGNDLILPFGIYVEYRIRGVSGSNKGLATTARPTSPKVGQEEGVRIPNQDGLPPVVLLKGLTNCVEWDQLPDADGNDPDGYRVLIASRTRRFSQPDAVTHYIGFESRDGVTQEPSGCLTGGEGKQGFRPTYVVQDPGWTLSDSDRTWWIVVQAYDGDGIAKGDNTGGSRKQGWEILKDINSHSNDGDALPPPRDTESETVPGDGS